MNGKQLLKLAVTTAAVGIITWNVFGDDNTYQIKRATFIKMNDYGSDSFREVYFDVNGHTEKLHAHKTYEDELIEGFDYKLEIREDAWVRPDDEIIKLRRPDIQLK